jgi:SAM-dependent methyltransferase
MAEFAAKHVNAPCRVADVGSYDVNGSFRAIFAHCEYVGLDIVPGPNVDRVVQPDYFGTDVFDVVVSGSCMEHVQNLHAWADQCVAITKPGGMLCIIVPHGMSGAPEHRHPVDCWRVWPDGMRWLFSDLEILDCRADRVDTVMIARRRETDARAQLGHPRSRR